MPNTPSGTRIWPTLMPLGRRFRPVISPIGSAIAASCTQPSATVSMMAGVSCRRSNSGAVRLALWRAASRSCALAACSAGPALRKRRASARRAAFLLAVGAAAITVDAARAAAPMWAIRVGMSAAFIRR